MTPTSNSAIDINHSLRTSSFSMRVRHILRLVLAAASWITLTLSLLITVFLAGWILLAVILVGGLTKSQPIPVIPILTVLVAITACLAWLVAHSFASPRKVSLIVGLITILFFIVGLTWAMSSPDNALFLARDIAWDGTDIFQVQQFPERAIYNVPPASYIQQNLSPELFQPAEYKQDGNPKLLSIDEFLKSTQTTSFIVIQDNAVLYESYFNGYTRDSVIPSFSIAKSFTSSLVGIAIHEGYIHSVDDPIVGYLPELRDRGMDRVTIRHLLTMSTGIQYVHGEELPPLLRPFPFDDDCWTTSFPNLRRLALSVKPDGEVPGSAWKYNNYYPQLLGMILERTTHRSVSEYMQEKIWQPLGMEYPASWSLDSEASGFEKMEQGVNARAIDFARFGMLYLNNGYWNGTQVIPEQWIADSTMPDPGDNRPWRVATEWKNANGYYKYMWWGMLRSDGSYAYMARGGMNQQWIYISPRDQLVIIHFGLDDGGGGAWWPEVFEHVVSKLK